MKKICALFLCLLLMGSAAFAEGYTAGTYTGTGYGNNGPITAEVTVSGDEITDIRIAEHDETYYMIDYVKDAIPNAILENQSLSVDVVSGASNSSRGVINAVKDALTQAGADIDALTAAKEPVEKTQREIETDILVVGAGMSGMSAANRALENGKNTLLLEQLDVIGGNARFAGGTFMLGLDEENRAAMKSYLDTRMYYADFPVADGTPDMERIYENVDATEKVYNMFQNIGVEVENLEMYGSYVYVGACPDKYQEPFSQITGFAWRGSFICEQQINAYLNNGGALMTGTKATELIVENGKVVGAMAESDTEILTIHADAVILATGSYSRNNDMLAKYIPTSNNDLFCTTIGDNGSGIQMALDVGGVMTTDNYINGGARVAYPATAMSTHNHTYSSSDVIGGGIITSIEGERLTLEGDDRYFRYYAVEDGLDSFFTIADVATMEANGMKESYEAKVSDNGPFFKADTLEELAAKTGMDPEKLAASVEGYNNYVRTGVDPFADVEGISTTGTNIDTLNAAANLATVENGPFYATKLTFVGFDLIGGLQTANHGEVLTADGTEIPGLYAVGFASSREFEGSGASHHYCLMLCLTTGLLAVDDACGIA